MRILTAVLIVILACFLHITALGKASAAFHSLPQSANQSFVLPSGLTRIAVLEFRGLASDIFFLNSMMFIGSIQQRRENPKVQDWEWRWWTKVVETAIELDPYFFDPYYFANAFLPWDAGMAKEANVLLEKGSRFRDWDWMLPFFIGFNNFLFLQNDKVASEYIMEASRRPGGDPMLASLAARLAFKSNRLETAIYFLEETAKRTDDNLVKRRYETRINALRNILVLDSAVKAYKKKFGKVPTNIDALVHESLLSSIPLDPYGGTYYLAVGGKVKSTKQSELEPYLSPSMQRRR